MGFMSLGELSPRLRVSPATLDEWISGETPIPDGATFALIAVLNEQRSKRT
jgi:DNA-binding transcriptional regulator YiaG